MRYSIVIKKDTKIWIYGNKDIIWYIDEITKKNYDIYNILNALKIYKDRFRKKNKLNILIIGSINREDVEKYKDYFNIKIEKDMQEKIIKYIKRSNKDNNND
ncbi:hypothetical protein MJ1_0211 [Nanobdella aerobiophila]|uniref:Uncharacterized protein n=1 Tax=Nanobdella aerobiophila TaxID=2586965 RepID=A0A915S9Z1_9ARCH|nr:hypothetical protein [Nanobdella aerobiophila]BBL45382.1 hypothetical protein MJ1_0211 [Nanobdella aerobiophila]